jgi:hypothetical protein
MREVIAALLPCSPVSLMGMVVGIWSLVILNRRNVIAAFAAPTTARLAATSPVETVVRSPGDVPKPVPARKSSHSLVWVAVVLLVFPCLAIPAWLVLSWGARPSASPVVDSPKKIVGLPEAVPSSGWVLGPDGPALTDTFARVVLKLRPEQTERVNEILRTTYGEFLTVERQNIEQRTDDAGHTVLTINPFRDAIARLEDRLWSQLDRQLDPQQQETARLNLRLDPVPVRAGMSVADFVSPGFFGWGQEGARLEIWRVGTWHHWKVQTRGYEYEARAPNLPAEYARFAPEPAAEATDIVSPPQ